MVSLGLLVFVITAVVINNFLAKYWKSVQLFHYMTLPTGEHKSPPSNEAEKPK